MLLQLLLPSLQLYMGGLHLECQTHHLLAQLEDGKSSKAEPECQEARGVYIRVYKATGSLLIPTTGLDPHGEAALVASEGAALSPEAELKSSSFGVSTPCYKEHLYNSCSIHVHLENQRGTEYKSIVLSESTSEAHAMVTIPACSDISPQKGRSKPMATKQTRKSRNITNFIWRLSRARSKQQVQDSCLIKIRLENQDAKHSKTILVTCNDRAPAIIRRSLDLLLKTEEDPYDYELGQIISHQHKMKIPGNANVYYAMNPRVQRNFVLRKSTYHPEENDDWLPPQPPTLETGGLRRKFWTTICSCLCVQ